MTDTVVNPAVVNLDSAEHAALVELWKVPTITGLVRRSKNLLHDLQGDDNGYLAAELLNEDVSDLEDGKIKSDTEVFDMFEVTKRTTALERYIDSRSFTDLSEGFGPTRIHLLVPEEVDAGDYGVHLNTAA